MNLRLSLMIVALVATFGCADTLNAGSTSARQKPLSPVSVSIESPSPEDTGVLEFIISARSQIDAQQFTIVVHPPKGMQLVRGDLSWRGPVRSGEIKTLRFSGSFTRQTNHTVLVNAGIESDTGPRFSAHASYVVPALSTGIQGFSQGSPVTEQGNESQRGDRKIIEYPVSR